MGFIAFILSVVALVIAFDVRSKVVRMERAKRNENLQDQGGMSSNQNQGSQTADPSSMSDPNGHLPSSSIPESGETTPIRAPEATTSHVPSTGGQLIAWIKDDWMLKLGALLVLIGFGWLVTYAFMNDWIGPVGRITLGILAGVLFIIGGWFRIKKYVHQGSVFLVLGSTIILLTVFAAREMYDMFTPTVALVMMFLSSAFVAYVSVVYKNRALSLASLLLAGVAPLLTASADPSYVGLFAYLFVVVLGTIWVVTLSGARELSFAALSIIFFYSLPHFFGVTSADLGILLLFAYGFSAVFYLTNTLELMKGKAEGALPDLNTALGNAFFLLIWIFVAAPEQWQSLIIISWMVVFLLGAFAIFQKTGKKRPFYVYAGVGIAMLAAATASELSGEALVIAYTIESAVIALLGYAFLRDVRLAERLCLLLIGPAMLSVGSLWSYAHATSVFNADFFVILLLGAVLSGLGLFLWYVRIEEGREAGSTSGILMVAGSMYAYLLLWLGLSAGLVNENVAVMMSLVVYTLVGLCAYFAGLSRKMKALQLYGGALVGFVVARLLLVDLWEMDMTGRIVTFFLIGALLIATAFVTKRKKDVPTTNDNL